MAMTPDGASTISGLGRRVMRSAVAWSFVSTFVRIGANFFVLPVLLRKLPPEQLGLWYVFGSLGAFAALLDLGFEPTIMRVVSYLWAGAERLVAFGLHDDTPAGARGPNRPLLSEVVSTLRVYYRFVGLGVFVLLATAGGAWIWTRTADLPDAGLLRWAWVAYAFGESLKFVSGRWPALLAGIGELRVSQQIVTVGSVVYYIAAVAGLLAGLRLWALVGAALLMGIATRWLGRLAFVRTASLPGGLPRARFHRAVFDAIWPNAWRTGLVAFGAFMIIQANTLVCSAFLDLAATASYGISLQLVTILVGLASVWVQVKIPHISQLRVTGESAAIARLFACRMRLVILSYAAGAVCIISAAPRVLEAIGSRTQLLPANQLAVLLVIQFLEMHHSLYGALVLTENRNPFLRPALVSGVLIVALSITLTPRLGVWGLLLSAGAVQIAFNNWWPVLRAIRGLGMAPGGFGRLFFTGCLPAAEKARTHGHA